MSLEHLLLSRHPSQRSQPTRGANQRVYHRWEADLDDELLAALHPGLLQVRVFDPLALDNLFRGGLVFKAHRLVYHSTLGWVFDPLTRDNLRLIQHLRLKDSCITQLKAQGPF